MQTMPHTILIVFEPNYRHSDGAAMEYYFIFTIFRFYYISFDNFNGKMQNVQLAQGLSLFKQHTHTHIRYDGYMDPYS